MSDQPSAPDRGDGGGGWLAAFATIPSTVTQPFSLSAVAIVAAVPLGLFGPLVACLSCIGVAVVLLGIGIWRYPRPSPALAAADSYTAVSGLGADTAVLDADTAGLSPIEQLCFLHLYQREGGTVGRNRIFPVDYFVDLMTASLIPEHRGVMVREMTEHLLRSTDLSDVSTLVSPKRGNSLLLVGAAEKLGLRAMFVKERPLFGKRVEGIGGASRRATVVDDISSDGELLVHCVTEMRAEGFEVTQALVLIDRTEGDAIAALADVGVSLLPLVRWSDADIRRIVERARRTTSPEPGEGS